MKIQKIIAVIVLSLVLFLPSAIFCNEKIDAVYADTTYSSYYLLDESAQNDEDKPFKSNVVAGETSGYSSQNQVYQLNDPVTLSTTANAGFKVVGWRVSYGSTVKYLTESGSLEGVDFTISNTTNNSQSEFRLEHAFDNMTVDPVFDYIHYNLEITSFSHILNKGTETELDEIQILNDPIEKYNDYVYYQTSTNNAGITTFENVILKRVHTFMAENELNTQTNFYYFTELKTDGDRYYTTKIVDNYGAGSSREIKTDYTYGCFTLGEVVTPEFVIDFNNLNLSESKNINLKSVAFNKNNLTKITSGSLYNNSYRETIDANLNLTTSFSCKVTIVNGGNTLEINKEDLYLFKIISFVGDETNGYVNTGSLSENERNFINQSYQVTAYSQVDSFNYIAGASGVSLVANDIGKVNPTTNLYHGYYTFEKMKYTLPSSVTETESSNKNFLLQTLPMNFEVKVYFNPCKYNINFEFKTLVNNTLQNGLGEEIVPDSFEATRGFVLTKDTEINSTTFGDLIANNTGYTFSGIYNNGTIQTKNEFSYQVDSEYPQDQTFYLVYEMNEYVVKLINPNSISLSNESISSSPTTFYPISSITLINGNQSDSISNVTGVQSDTAFETKIKIGDTVNFSYYAVSGFKINGINFVASGQSDCNGLNLTIDKDFIDNYLDADVFNIEADVEFEEYTLTYLTYTTIENSNEVIIAQIGVQNENGTPFENNVSKYRNANEIDNNVTSPYKIVVEKLKLYDVVYLAHDKIDDNYRFLNMQLGDFVLSTTNSRYKFVVNRADTKSYAINVNYTNITNKVTISSNIDSAFDLSDANNYVVLQNGAPIDISENGVNKGDDNNHLVSILLDNNKFSKGYSFVSYTIREDLSTTISTENYAGKTYKKIVFMPSEEGDYNIVLNFEYIKYYYEVYGKIGNEDVSKIETNSQYITLENVDSKTISFEKTLGYYVDRFGYTSVNKTDKTDEEYYELVNSLTSGLPTFDCAQTNEDKTQKQPGGSFLNFSHTFTSDEFSLLIDAYTGTNLVFVVQYTPFVYDVTINVELPSTAIPDGKTINTQSITLSYLNESNELVESTIFGLTQKFESIDYGTEINVNIDNIRKGLTFASWRYGTSVYTEQQTIANNVTFKVDNSLTISSLDNDYVFTLNLDYKQYSVLFAYDKTENTYNEQTGNFKQGQVTAITINNIKTPVLIEDKDDVGLPFKMFNTIYYTFETNELDGYTYNGVYLKINKDKFSFAQNEIYEKDGNKFVLTGDEQFEENKEYFISLPITKYTNNSEVTFEVGVNNVDLENYETNNDQLIFYFEFEFFEFKISGQSVGVENIFIEGSMAQIYFKNSQNKIATYKFFAKSQSEEEFVELTSDDLINVNYTVKVEVQLGKYENIDLYRGLVLNQFQIGSILALNNNTFSFFEAEDDVYDSSKTYQLMYVGNGKYVIYFNMLGANSQGKKYISVVDIENKELELKFGYIARNGVQLKTTTSIPSNADSFYNTGTSPLLTIRNNDLGTNNSNSKSNSYSSYAQSSSQFLSNIDLQFNFRNNNQNYFKVTAIIFTNEKGEDIVYYDTEDFDEVAIYGMNTTNLTDLFEKNGIMFNLSLVENLVVTFKIEPKIKLKIGKEEIEYDSTKEYSIEKIYLCDVNGVGQEQTVESDVVADAGIKNAMIYTYYKDKEMTQVAEVKNVGLYYVKIEFDLNGTYGSMLKDVVVKFSVRILPLEIYLEAITPESKMPEKTYNATDNYSVNELIRYIKIKAENSLLNVNYTSQTGELKFILSIPEFAKIRENDSDISASSASEANEFYDLKIYGITLKENDAFNSNFTLKASDLTFSKVVQIKKREISIFNLGAENILNKVYDGTNRAYIKDKSIITFQKNNVLNNDDITINTDKIMLEFEKYDVSGITRVKVDLTGAIEGSSARNYTVKTMQYYVDGKIIYPQKISVNITNYGTVSIENIDVLNDPTNESLISLLPLNANLIVDTIYSESVDFIDLYQNSDLSDYLSNRRIFSVGYNVYLADFRTGQRVPIDNRLYIRLPSVEKLTQVLNIYNNTATNLYYNVEEDGTILIKLDQIGDNLHYLIMIEDRPVVQLWQIILISVGSAAVVGSGIGLFIFLRKRKLKLYSLREKI